MCCQWHVDAVFDPTRSKISHFQATKMWWKNIATGKNSLFTSELNVESNKKVKIFCHRHFKSGRWISTLVDKQQTREISGTYPDLLKQTEYNLTKR